ncbi:hypothetical protein GGH93_005915 [Coemansia aciculifera]|nr:hypothetical protein GGH93_005915 [Coemansia aciculifera]
MAAAMVVISASTKAAMVANNVGAVAVNTAKAVSPDFMASIEVGGDTAEAESEAANDLTTAATITASETTAPWQDIKAALDAIKAASEATIRVVSKLEAAAAKPTDYADEATIAVKEAVAAVKCAAADTCTASQNASYALNALSRMEVGLIPSWSILQRLHEMQDWAERYVAEHTPVVAATTTAIDMEPATTD